MSFYTDASLVLIPSGIKDQKVYCAKPVDGSGDLVFSRSNDTATRVGSDGLIEKVRTNLITYSEDFGNAAWAVNNSTKTTSQTDPNSGTTAVKIVSTANVNSGIYQNKTASSTTRTASLWMKGEVGGEVVEYGDATNRATATLTTSWVRYSFAAADASAFFVIYNETASPVVQTWYVAFVQYENGDIATDYIATTTAAVSVGPVANLPRLDYLDSSCPRLLLEPQRTNVIQNSENLSGANWTKTNCTTSTNVATAPDGNTSADKLIMDNGLSPTSAGADGVYQVSSITSGVYNVSFFVKAAEFNSVNVRDNAITGAFLNINLTTGAVTNPAPSQFVGAQAVNYGNGWYRVSFTTTTIVATQAFSIRAGQTGDGTSGFLLWGVQYELGAFETSYIPTLGATVTRGAESASKTGISSLIGQTEGAFMIDVNLDDRASFTYFAIAPDLALASNYLGIGLNASSIVFESVSGSVLQAGITLSNSATGRFKIAVAYKANDFVMYVNGTQVGTDTSGSVPTCSQVGLYQYSQTPSVKYNQTLLFPTRLSNADLAALTA